MLTEEHRRAFNDGDGIMVSDHLCGPFARRPGDFTEGSSPCSQILALVSWPKHPVSQDSAAPDPA